MGFRPGQSRILIVALALLLALSPVLSWSMPCCQTAEPDSAQAVNDCHDAGSHDMQSRPDPVDSQTAPDCPECDHCVGAQAMPGIESAMSVIPAAKPRLSHAIPPADSPPEHPFKPPLA